MIARLAQSCAQQQYLADPEFLPHKVVERYAARDEVAPSVTGSQLDRVVAREPFKGLAFDERHFAIGNILWRKRSRLRKVTIALESVAGHCPDSRNGVGSPLGLRRDVDGFYDPELRHRHLRDTL